MFNKFIGVVSSMKDENGCFDLWCFIVDYEEWLYNVGCLDVEISGLLILINDGVFVYVLVYLLFGVIKVYIVKVEGIVLF